MVGSELVGAVVVVVAVAYMDFLGNCNFEQVRYHHLL